MLLRLKVLIRQSSLINSIIILSFAVSKVEEDSFVENYLNWGPEYRISFDLMILKEAAELQSIFAFLGRHFATVPQILLEGLTLRFTTSDYMSGKRNVKYETDINIHQWTPIVIETRQGTDNTVRVHFCHFQP